MYGRAFDAAMEIFDLSRRFPKDEVYSLTDQMRRSSRSVCANLAETWRKRWYPAAFISKLSDAEAEAAETQVWIHLSVRCGYMDRDTGGALYQRYNRILATLVGMIRHANAWSPR
jgi:four helix bundle protein